MSKKKRIIYVAIASAIIVIAALAIIFMPKTAPQTVTEMLSTAQKYLVEMEYERAIAEFNKVIELDPMNADAYLGLAEAYEKLADVTLKNGYELTGDDRLQSKLALLMDGDETAEATETVTDVSETISETISETSVSQEQEPVFSADRPNEILKSACQIIGMFGTEQRYDKDAVFYFGGPYECGYYKVKDFASDEYHYVYFNNVEVNNESLWVQKQRVYTRGRLFDVDEPEHMFTAYSVDDKIKYNNEYKFSFQTASVNDFLHLMANTYLDHEENNVYYFNAGGSPGTCAEIKIIDNKITEIVIPAKEWFTGTMNLRCYYDENEKSWLLYYEYEEGNNTISMLRDSELPYYSLPYDKGIIYPTVDKLPDDFDSSVFDIPENSSGYSSYESWSKYTGVEFD